jgi:hypothetical protein
MPGTLTTNMRQTTDAFIRAWEAWKADPIMAVRAPECIISQFPTSLQIPDRDNDDFRKWFGGVEGLLSNCKVSRQALKGRPEKGDVRESVVPPLTQLRPIPDDDSRLLLLGGRA